MSFFRKSPPQFLALAPILIFLGVTPALQSQDIPPPNTNNLLDLLDKVSANSAAIKHKRRLAALSQIDSATSSGPAAVDLYCKAVDNTTYRINHQAYVDWNRGNDEALRSTAFQTAALFQMRYLSLGLQQDEKHDAYSQVRDYLIYLKDLAKQQTAKHSVGEKIFPQAAAILQQPLNSTEIVQWLQVSDLLPDPKNFAAAPGNYQEIMEKNIRVPLRKMKDKHLPETWDMQIAFEAEVATASDDPEKEKQFNKIHLPELLFSKDQDLAVIGQPNRAVTEVIKMIQNYPDHPAMSDWIEYARQNLSSTTNSVPSPSQEGEPTNGTSPQDVLIQTPSTPPTTSGTTSATNSKTSPAVSPFGTLTPP